MTLDPKSTAALALHRFGLGPRPGQIALIASDPRGALLAELDKPNINRIAGAGLMGSAEAARALFEYRAEQQARQIVAKREADRQQAMADTEAGKSMTEKTMAEKSMADDAAQKRDPSKDVGRQIFLGEAKARVDAALTADIGFAERLVWFWSNHFCISADKIPSMAGAYEREAIRPHVLGRFGDMLLAAESHPAMLFYLDNWDSIGPNSVAGINRSKGLNENLAREILELHTLGVRSGYTQSDVTSFANVLTGWSMSAVSNPDHGGEFVFVKRMHEPGDKTVLGKSYADDGVGQGRAVLADLARHPATATHVAQKLAKHFVADQPPQPLVDRLAKVFRDTGGDLKAVTVALVKSDEAWSARRGKLKRPDEWLISALRVGGVREPGPDRVVGAQNMLGQPLWRPPSPQGFSDEEAAWLDGLPTRLDIASTYAARIWDRLDPHTMVDEALGPLASRETRETVMRAESKTQAFAMLLLSSEFQRR
ncbi:DUF1800 domain-containing protein [Rhodoplanes sp. Z2-YC6860]|uniref:DUF1800 domain-containing protein n=1 Tax=Rhodoplanes sp. Z2-YC6860 TaxID=674703 RepID=UPI00078DC936|nr:DUF1800 family protein [Rhodoplanes sp. Z2-YC6860]AMN40130.1 hypothetical protein RHPLAN_16750 [Rhodoplanes sp. Z2-YC6860]